MDALSSLHQHFPFSIRIPASHRLCEHGSTLQWNRSARRVSTPMRDPACIARPESSFASVHSISALSFSSRAGFFCPCHRGDGYALWNGGATCHPPKAKNGGWRCWKEWMMMSKRWWKRTCGLWMHLHLAGVVDGGSLGNETWIPFDLGVTLEDGTMPSPASPQVFSPVVRVVFQLPGSILRPIMFSYDLPIPSAYYSLFYVFVASSTH